MALYYLHGPSEDAQAQMLISDIITIDEGTYYYLLAAREMVDRFKNIPAALRTTAQQQAVDMEAVVDNVIASYNTRQAMLKQQTWLERIQQGIKDGWQWLASKFSPSVSGRSPLRGTQGVIGAFPVAIAVIAAIVVAGGATAYVITELQETKSNAETDQSRIAQALDAMLSVPGVEASDIADLVTGLPTTQNASGFDKIIDLVKWGALAAVVYFGVKTFSKK